MTIPDDELAALREAWSDEELQHAYRWLRKDGLEAGMYAELARRAPRVTAALGWLESFAEYLEARAIEDRATRRRMLEAIEKWPDASWESTRSEVRPEDLPVLDAWIDRLANLEQRLFGAPRITEVGERVRHSKFGPGTIAEVAGDNVRVQFDDGTEKRIRRAFLEMLD